MNKGINMMKEIERENTSLKRTLRYISHEMLNILTIMDYSVKAVDGAIDEVKDNKYWNYIVGDVDYMVKVLRKLSEYNHCDEIEKRKGSLYSEVMHICSEMKDKYRDMVNIIPCIDGKADLYNIKFDKSRIRQVMVNLIKNAVEATSGVENGIIFVCMKKESNCVSVEVIDNGCGINAPNKDIVFQEGISIDKNNGSGLGLAISKKIIESHGGSISVKSEPNHGTIFRFTLPLN